MKTPATEIKQFTDSGYSEVIETDTVCIRIPSESQAIETLRELANSENISGQLSFNTNTGELPLFRGSHLDYYRQINSGTLNFTGTVSAETHHSFLRRGQKIGSYDILDVTPIDVIHQLAQFLRTRDTEYEKIDVYGGDNFISLGESTPSKGAIFIEELTPFELQIAFEIECDDTSDQSDLYRELYDAAKLFGHLHDFVINIDGRTGIDAQLSGEDIYVGRSEQFSATIAERILWEQLDAYNQLNSHIILGSDFTLYTMLEHTRRAVDDAHIIELVRRAIQKRRQAIYAGDTAHFLTNNDILDSIE